MLSLTNLITLVQTENSLLQRAKSLRTDLQNASEDISLLFEKIGMSSFQIIEFLDCKVYPMQNYYSYHDDA